jgi:hypothetical protein
MHNTLERLKLFGGNYKYFICNNDGETIKDLQEKFIEPVEIGALYQEEINVEGEKVNQPTRIFYLFSYSDTVIYNKLDDDLEVIGKDEESLPTKAIIDNNGNVIIDKIKRVVRFIPEVGFIVSLLIIDSNGFKIGWWKNFLEELSGETKDLFGVIDFDGRFIIKPTSHAIEFLEEHEMFFQHNKSLLQTNKTLISKDGNKQNFMLQLSNQKNLSDYEIFILKNKDVVIFNSDIAKKGLMRNGEVLITPQFDELFITENKNLFVVSVGNKWGFVSPYNRYENQFEQVNTLQFVTDLIFDEIIFLSGGGFICKNYATNTIQVILGLEENSNPPKAMFYEIDAEDENTALSHLNTYFRAIGNSKELFMINRKKNYN